MERERRGTLERVPRTPSELFPNYLVVRNRHCCTVPGFSYLFITVVTGWLACRSGARRGASLFDCLPILPLACFLAPIPPTPFPAGRGCPKVYFAGGSAPGTPALNRLRHLQILPYGCLAGSWLFCSTGFCRPGKAPRLGFQRAMPVSRPFSPGDARGEAFDLG